MVHGCQEGILQGAATESTEGDVHCRGHEVMVVGAAPSMHFFKQAAERHSSNSSAEALKYLEVDLTPPSPGSSHHKPVRPAQVTHSRFAGTLEDALHQHEAFCHALLQLCTGQPTVQTCTAAAAAAIHHAFLPGMFTFKWQ